MGIVTLRRLIMIESIKKHNISENFRIRLVKSKKFKTDLVGLFLLRPLNDEEASNLALISRLLSRGSSNLPNAKVFNNRLDELYGAVFSSDVVKYGERIALHVKMQFPNKKLIDNKNILKDSIQLINDTIFDIYSDDDQFNQEYFDQEKMKLTEEINSRINDKIAYAVERCVEVMCEDEPYSVYHYGSVDTVKKLENKDVYAYYKRMKETSPLDVLVIGDIDFDESYQLIESTFDFKENGIVKIIDEQSVKEVEAVKYITEEMNVNQGKLSLGYRTNIHLDDILYEPAVLFVTILGGGGNSTLFRNIREKESLCYYIFSKLEKFKSLMLISSGIEVQNYDKALKLILEEVDKLKRGDFTQEDIDVAKEAIISSVKSLSDYPNSFINFYYSRELSGHEYDEVKIIEEVMAVTKEQIMEAGNRFVLDTVHFIKGGE